MLGSFEAIVRDYRRRYGASVPTYLAWFGDPTLSLAGAIERACRSMVPDPDARELVFFGHQHRPGHERMANLAARLAAEEATIGSASSFAELYDLVAAHAARIDGVGPLTTYDVAHRIGAYLGLQPELIYLHCGTLDGAVAVGIAKNRTTASVDEMPGALQSLTPAELEDVLCIYLPSIRHLVGEAGPEDPRRRGSCRKPQPASSCHAGMST